MLHWMVLTALASTPSDTADTPADETSEEDSPTPIIRPDDGRPEDNMLLETERDDVGLLALFTNEQLEACHGGASGC